jgi:hypothetical protein
MEEDVKYIIDDLAQLLYEIYIDEYPNGKIASYIGHQTLTDPESEREDERQ